MQEPDYRAVTRHVTSTCSNVALNKIPVRLTLDECSAVARLVPFPQALTLRCRQSYAPCLAPAPRRISGSCPSSPRLIPTERLRQRHLDVEY